MRACVLSLGEGARVSSMRPRARLADSGVVTSVLIALLGAVCIACAAPTSSAATDASPPPVVAQSSASPDASVVSPDASAPSADDAGVSPVASSRIVRAGLYENEPKVFTDAKGRPAGFFVDLLDAIGEKEGWTVVWVPMEWEAGLKALEDGHLDLMPDVAYSAERAALYDFNQVPVIESWSQLYVDPHLMIDGFSSLDAKRVAVLEGSVQEEEFRKIVGGLGLDVTLVPVKSYDRAFELTRSGTVDAAITNRFYGDRFYRDYGLKRTDIVFSLASLYFATAKGTNGDLLAAIDSTLRTWKQQPGSPYYQALTRWLEQPTTTSTEYRISRRLAWTLGIIAALLVATTIGVIVSRRQVKRQARDLARTNLALSREQRRLADIIEFLPDATFVVDEHGRVVAWNRACETMTGVAKDSVLGRGEYAHAEPFFGERRPMLIDLLDMPADDAATLEAEARRLNVRRAGGMISAESYVPHLRRGAGAYLWGQAAPLFDQDGRRCGAIEVIRDTTEQWGIEEALRESEQKYRELVEHANSIILRWTHEGRITFLNEFGQRFFGYSEDEIIGRHVVGTIVPAQDAAGHDLRPLMDEICAEPAAFEQNVNENVRRDGEHVWIAWTNKIKRDADGQVSEILSVGTDITELKKAEEAIRELNTTLEERVARRTAELAVAKERAEEADRIKSAFLATMSHELRTPLNSIIGFTGIVLQELAGPLNEEQRKQLEMVRDSARHLLALINDVLDISKIEAGQLKVNSEPFDLGSSIEKVTGIVAPLAKRKGLTLRAGPVPELGEMVSDPRRVEQILLNLLNNAIKFTDRGAITLTTEAIEGAGRGTPSAIRISVADTGIGIKPEDLRELFQPFRQIDTGLTRSHEGTGLGLAICRRLAELLGGEVQATSDWGKGSVFTLTLPAKGQGEP